MVIVVTALIHELFGFRPISAKNLIGGSMKVTLLFACMFSLTISALAQGRVASDALGLERASQESAGRIPVGIASAIEASQLPQSIGSILGYFYGTGGYYYSSELGNELQPRVADMLMRLRYAPVIPKTGFQGQQRESIITEMTPEDPEARVEFFATPRFVIIPTVSFVEISTKERRESLRPLANIIGQITKNSRVNETIYTASNTDATQGSQMVKATFALRFYNQAGVQVKAYEACAQEIPVAEYRTLNAALIYQSASTSSSSLQPLAAKLIVAMEARLQNPGMTCPK